MRKPLFWCAVALSVALLPGCTQTIDKSESSIGVTDSTILLGSSNALSGHASFLGTQYNIGSQVAFSEVNDSGGIFGRKIELKSYDDQYDPPQTVANTEKLITEDQVFMLFNYVGTPTSVQIIDDVQAAQIPSLGFLTGAEALRTPYRPFMFHLRASYYAEVEAAVSLFVDDLKLERIAVLYQDDAFGLAVLAGIQLALNRRDKEIVAAATYARGSMDVEEAVSTVAATSADAVLMVGTYSPLAKIIKESQNRRFSPYFHTVSFIGSEAFASELVRLEIDPAQYERIIVTQVVPSPYGENLEGVMEYQRLLRKYSPDQEPNYVSLEGYLNARLLVDILQRNGPVLTRESLSRTIEGVNSLDLGIENRVSFGHFDHMGLEDIYTSRMSPQGNFQVFETAN